jgi:hypothetical protein
MTGSTIAVGGTLQSGPSNIVSTVTHDSAGAPILVRLKSRP